MNTKGSSELLETKVKKANKEFYDIVSTSYEKIDGKRDATTTVWIKKKLQRISREIGEKSLLDIGCGSGFIMRNARGVFSKIVGIDISHKILVPLQKQGYMVVCADTDHLPFKENSFSVVTCFAVLHHLYKYDGLFQEARRILKKEGLFYSDHDLDKAFSKRFSTLFMIYRFFFNEEKKYRKKETKITSELYHCTEIHNKGIPTETIVGIVKNAGFTAVQTSYHWFGLFPLLTKLLLALGYRHSRQRNAPLVSLLAKK